MSEFYDVVGPVDIEALGVDVDLLGAEEIAALPTVDGAFMSEWMVLSAWSTMDGDVYTSKYVLPSMPQHHQLGLIARWHEELR